jgi:hypothetical protein
MYLALVILTRCVLLLFVPHECADGMLKYSASELYWLRWYDVTVNRSIRKTIFSHHLWWPCRTRETCNELLPKSTQRIWSPSIALNWSSTRSSPTPHQQLMTSSQSSPSEKCIWSPSTAFDKDDHCGTVFLAIIDHCQERPVCSPCLIPVTIGNRPLRKSQPARPANHYEHCLLSVKLLRNI